MRCAWRCTNASLTQVYCTTPTGAGQYASGHIRRLLQEHAIQVSMSRKGNCYDNAVMESFFSTLKRECVSCQVYPTRKQASLEVFAYIAGYYNRVRLHATLGYASPEQFEAEEPSSP